jgi:hypothetical protein
MTESKGGHTKTDRASAAVDQIAPAIYVNYFEVGHNPFEFLVELGQYHPGSSEADGSISIHTRIAIAPPYAKMLSDLLAHAVEEHESRNGQIASIGPQANPFDIVLSSLGDYEDRARALRARDRNTKSTAADVDLPAGKTSTTPSRSRKGR